MHALLYLRFYSLPSRSRPYLFCWIFVLSSALSEYFFSAGHTFAKDAVLSYNIAQAIQQADIPIKYVNISFPDHTNYALGKVGLAPTTGAGTIDLTV